MNLTHSEIVETVFYGSGSDDVDFEILQQDETDLADFSIDAKGRVRRSGGIVSCGVHEDDNFDYVPSVRYEIQHSAWNSHGQYVEMTLPNPATEPARYTLIRAAMLEEFSRRLRRQIKNAKARLARSKK